MDVNSLGASNLSDTMVRVVNTTGVVTHLDFYPASVAYSERDHDAFGLSKTEFNLLYLRIAAALASCIYSVAGRHHP